MAVDEQHPQYKEYGEIWARCRDVTDGSDKVKRKGEKYLPKLSGQTNDEYKAYKRRALFFSVAGRSLSGLVGMATRRTAKVEASDEMKSLMDMKNSTNKISFRELLMRTVEEVLKTARYFILIDFPKSGGKSYVATYTAETVINWDLDEDLNLVSVVLRESVIEKQADFKKVTKTIYRHLHINAQGDYQQDIYDGKTKKIASTIIPTVSGKPLKVIPGVCVGPNGIGFQCEKPPILDIVDVNISQYMSSADLEHGRHFTGLPTAYITGAPDEGELKIGSSTAWMITNEKAKVGFLEFQGLGLKSLENAISEKTAQMAQFSTRLMDTSTRGSEAAETVRLRHSAEAATLSTVVDSVESALNIIYSWIGEFEGEEFDSISLNKDFLDTKLSSQELRELTKALIEGAIDEETYFYNLEKGEITSPDKQKFDVKPRVDDD